MKSFKIGNYDIGKAYRPFIIAEMSGNHNQSLERALEIVEAAARSGAHMLKLQTYTSDTMTLNVSSGEFLINDEKSLWKGNNLYDLYKIADPMSMLSGNARHGIKAQPREFRESIAFFGLIHLIHH